MPRIYTGDNSPLDFCQKHFPTEEEAKKLYGKGEGPDGRGNCFGYDDDHPDYDGENYHCHQKGCEKLLTGVDNEAKP